MIAAHVSTLLISRISEAGDQLFGEPDFARWERLLQAVQQLDSVRVDLRLQRRGRVLLVDGELRLQGRLRCERCLGGMSCDIRQHVRVGVADTEAALAAIDAERELVMAAEGKLAVQDWLEEEALLALPLLPRCMEWSSGICPVSGIEVPSLDANQ
ncbi:YceD family protein [Acidithiobacillus sp. AMEEHan]|uniref:YceD family protein n=1 Tax=Acidithiobacillus sp. AMEEHan TaxID=2994951 RepID=UPI0027E5162F|nr:YceD family protein [Acidithiobacillus sp. AMEEHan]